MIILVFSIYPVFSQTSEIEQLNLTDRFKRGEIEPEDYKKYVKDWQRLIKEMGDYPEFPFDTVTKSIKFKYLKDYNHTKEIIYNNPLCI